MVSNNPDSSQPDKQDGTSDSENDDGDEDDDYTDFINPRKSLPLKSSLSDESDQRRLSRILERLFDALRDRIS